MKIAKNLPYMKRARNLMPGDKVTIRNVGEVTVTRVVNRNRHVTFETDLPSWPSSWVPHYYWVGVKDDMTGKGFKPSK